MAALEFECAGLDFCAALVVVGRGRHGAIQHQRAHALLDQAAEARDLAAQEGLARPREGEVGGPRDGGAIKLQLFVFQGQIAAQRQAGRGGGTVAAGVVDRGVAREPHRAGPGVVAARISQRAPANAGQHALPVQGQVFMGNVVIASERQFQRAVDDFGLGSGHARRRAGGRRRAQRVLVGDAERAPQDRGLARIGVGGVQGDRGVDYIASGIDAIILREARIAGEHGVDHAAYEREAINTRPRGRGQLAFGGAARAPARVVDRAVVQGHAEKGVIKAREVKRAAGDQQHAIVVDGVGYAQLERAALDRCVARVGVDRA